MISISGVLNLSTYEQLKSDLNELYSNSPTAAALNSSILVKVVAFGNYTATAQVGLRVSNRIYVYKVDFLPSPVGGMPEMSNYNLYYHDVLSLLRAGILCSSSYSVSGDAPPWTSATLNVTSECISGAHQFNLRNITDQILQFLADNNHYVDLECVDERPAYFEQFRQLLLIEIAVSAAIGGLPAVISGLAALIAFLFKPQRKWDEEISNVEQLKHLSDVQRARFRYAKRRVFRILGDVKFLKGNVDSSRQRVLI